VFSLWSKRLLFGLYGFVWEKGCRTVVVLRSFDMGAWHGCCHSGMAHLWAHGDMNDIMVVGFVYSIQSSQRSASLRMWVSIPLGDEI
jgi:hypothetical protein